MIRTANATSVRFIVSHPAYGPSTNRMMKGPSRRLCSGKIDYYDNSLEFGSAEPWNALKMVRVLTIMLASEY